MSILFSLLGHRYFLDTRFHQLRECSEDWDAQEHPEAAADGGYQGVKVVDVVFFGADDHVSAVADVHDPTFQLLLVLGGQMSMLQNQPETRPKCTKISGQLNIG